MIGYNDEHKGWKFFTPDHTPSIRWSNSAKFHEHKGWHDQPKVQSPLQIRFESLKAESAKPEANDLEPEPEIEEFDMQDSLLHAPIGQLIDDTEDNQLEIAVEDMIGGANTTTLNLTPTMKEALTSEDAQQWQEAICKELDGLEAMGTWEVVDVLPNTRCHGPGCSRSRRVTGSYGRSTGIEDLVDTSREHGRSAVSMETMDSYGLTCKGEPSHMRGGPGTAMRRTKLKEQAQPRRGPSSDGYHSGARETRVIGHWQAGPEEEEQCRGSRHQVMRRRSSVKGVDTRS
ncbi:hypothetical protein NDA11_003902 [Ustilago hordei]|nr:hypothetical protein NDA12_000726 [Ustilago hordei]KAJ1576129.1 hypothetical protein NDA15_002354 [Ustilago hordei]KAJ1593830.1 hypothetical protein NDA11_003902 [Ustilago hordei]